MTSKGQVTVPVEVRRALGLQPGSRLSFTPEPDGSYRLSVRRASVMDAAGMLMAPRSVSLEEMDEAIALAAVDSGRAPA
jgi:AbrB family looped-hinge helix DNA binding protein